MNKIRMIILGILVLSFKPNIPTLNERTYSVKGTLEDFVYSHRFLDRIKTTLSRTSTLSAEKVSAIIDTISMIQNFSMNQIEEQYATFQFQDSITNAHLKKDSLKKK